MPNVKAVEAPKYSADMFLCIGEFHQSMEEGYLAFEQDVDDKFTPDDEFTIAEIFQDAVNMSDRHIGCVTVMISHWVVWAEAAEGIEPSE